MWLPFCFQNVGVVKLAETVTVIKSFVNKLDCPINCSDSLTAEHIKPQILTFHNAGLGQIARRGFQSTTEHKEAGACDWKTKEQKKT